MKTTTFALFLLKIPFAYRDFFFARNWILLLRFSVPVV